MSTISLDRLEAEFAETKSDVVVSKLIRSSDEMATIAAQLNCSRPKLELPGPGRLISDFALELAKLLKQQGMYERGDAAFVVNAHQDGLALVTPEMLRTWVEQHVVCYKERRTQEGVIALSQTMSTDCARAVLAAPQFQRTLPKIERVSAVRLPIERADRRIELLPEGYDEQSETFTAIGAVPYRDDMSITDARIAIDELLEEFCFADQSRSKAVAVAAMLTLFGFGLLPKGSLRPLLIYLANAEGAGKTLLASCAVIPVYGRAERTSQPKDEPELRKELLTAIMEAKPYLFIDNCKGHLNSEALEAFATASHWSGRILGLSRSFSGTNNVTVIVTGNGCTVSPDIRRRSLFSELFLECERAEERKFRRVLDDRELLSRRSEILAALWAFVREWDAAGRPKPSNINSSFPRWCEIIGGITEVAGYGCPCEPAIIEGAMDTDGNDMCRLIELLDGKGANFEQVVSLSQEHGLFERFVSNGGDLTPSNKSRFGKALARYKDRIFGNRVRFIIKGKGRRRIFRTEPITGGNGGTGFPRTLEKTGSSSGTEKPVQTCEPDHSAGTWDEAPNVP